jgi:CubicO group peptidase (beta-lactamase class C family)
MMIVNRFENQINELIFPYLKKRKNLILTIGVFKDGKKEIFSKGSLNEYEEIDPGDMMYEIGSITKVYTASLLAKMIAEKKVDFNHSIDQYIPSLSNNTTLKEHPVTLRHLTTHTSGLPSIPFNFMLQVLFSKNKKKNPYKFFTNDDIVHFLENYTFRPERGKFKYSNLGVGLLGYVLSKGYDLDYENVIQNEICKPMNLVNTSIHLTPNQKLNLIPGHNSKGKPVPNWDFNSLEGAGALRSTVKDQMKFLEYHLGMKEDLNHFLSQTHEVQFEEKGISIGMNWIIEKEKNVIWHNGGTGGYSSFMGFNKEEKTGVIVLSNYSPSFSRTESVDFIGFGLLEKLSSD